VLLSSLIRRDRSRPAPRSLADDSGVALAAVLIVMAIGLLLSVLIVSSTSGALRYTSASRAEVQSQAAADAGIAAATAAFQRSGCTASYSSSAAPVYSATVWSTASTAATPASGEWVNACPTNASTKVRVVSRGTASTLGATSGQSAQDTTIVEAVYALQPVSDTTTTTSTKRTDASGVGLYISNGTSGNFSRFSVEGGSSTEKPDVLVDTGSFSCLNSSYIAGNLVVPEGSAAIDGTCRIASTAQARDDVIVGGTANSSVGTSSTGDIRAGRDVSIAPGMYVGGVVFANGNASISGRVYRDVEVKGRTDINSGALISGYVRTDGLLNVQGRIEKWATVGSAEPAPTVAVPVTVGNGAFIGDYLRTSGDLNSDYINGQPSPNATRNEQMAWYLKDRRIVIGTIGYRQTRPTPIPLFTTPDVPAWTDVGYDLSKWTADGFSEVTWPVTSGCTVDSASLSNTSGPIYTFMQQLAARTTPTVVNALGCPRLVFSGAGTVRFKTDMAFIANGLDITGTTLDSDSTTERRVWFIVPDQAPGTPGRDCSDSSSANSTGRVVISGGTRLTSTVRGLVYTPCQIRPGEMAWRGQFYTHQVSSTLPGTASGRGTLAVVTLGIPGYNLDGNPVTSTGTTTTTTTPYTGPRTLAASGALVSMRNRMTLP
jgi:hypothetical protein